MGRTLATAALQLGLGVLLSVGSTTETKSKAADKSARLTLYQPFIKMLQGQVALLAVPFLAVADFVLQWRQQVEVMLAGWKFLASAWVT